MIKVGDIVRYSNKFISVREWGPGCRHGRNYSSLRGKQRLMQVVAVEGEDWNWTTKTHNKLVKVDALDGTILAATNDHFISTSWLRLVRRPVNPVILIPLV